MNKLFAVLFCLTFCAFACKKNPNGTTANGTEAQETTHLVNKTNLAWSNAEELNERVSPPKNAYVKTDDGLEIAVHYSAPSVKNRAIWDSLVPYNQVWRIGANEASVIEFSHDVHIAGKHIMAGSYGVFCVPTDKNWTLILNSVADQWGAYDYDKNKDIARFELNVEERPFTEVLNFQLKKQDQSSVLLSFAWEKRGFELTIEKATDSAH